MLAISKTDPVKLPKFVGYIQLKDIPLKLDSNFHVSFSDTRFEITDRYSRCNSETDKILHR